MTARILRLLKSGTRAPPKHSNTRTALAAGAALLGISLVLGSSQAFNDRKIESRQLQSRRSGRGRGGGGGGGQQLNADGGGRSGGGLAAKRISDTNNNVAEAEANRTFALHQIADLHYSSVHFSSNADGTSNALSCALNVKKFDICLDLNGFNSDIASATAHHFVNAKTKWESVIIGHLPPASSIGLDRKYMCNAYPVTIDDLYICGKGRNLDGPGGLLGFATVAYYRTSTKLPLVGYMEFDNADIQHLGDNFEEVVLHEMGHVLGIGKLFWDITGAVQNNEYVGEAGVREWQRLGCQGRPPVELDGPDGTKYSHWDEGIMRDELMTGFLNGCDPCPLSSVTVATLDDLGYDVNYDMADPYEPNCQRVQHSGETIPHTEEEKPTRSSSSFRTRNRGGRGQGRGEGGRARLLYSASRDASDRRLSDAGLAHARSIGQEQLRQAHEERFRDEKMAKRKGGRGTGKVEFAADQFVDVIFQEGSNIYAVDVMAPQADYEENEKK